MVAATLRRSASFTGVRPMDLARDLAGVAEVLTESFRSEMDPAGARAVREMRTIGRLGPLAWWVELFLPVGEGFWPGFVWVEQGRVVGNATIRRAPTFGRGYLVGNVAVLPEYRGRGIARRLMEVCLEKACDEGGEWVALEVHVDNVPARHLYQSLGFQQIGAVVQWRREASTTMPDQGSISPDAQFHTRRARGTDERAVLALAQAATPEGLRWAEPLRESEFSFGWDRRLELWLAGRRESWWVVESKDWVVGAIEAETSRLPREEGRLRMWVAQGHTCHAALLNAALGAREVAGRSLFIAHPATDVHAAQVLEHFGFRHVWTRAHMKLNLK